MKTKTTLQLAELNAAMDSLTQAVRRLRGANEPILLMRVGGLLKDLLIQRNSAALSQ